MSEYRNKLSKVNGIISKAKADRVQIIKSGLQDWKIKQDLKALETRVTREIRGLGEELQGIAVSYVNDGRVVADRFRRKGKEPALMNYHQGRATESFRGLSPDQMLAKYDLLAQVLQEDESEYLYVYEDTIKSMLSNPAYEVALNETLNKHKGELERAALAEVSRRENFLNHDKTLRGLAEEEAKSAAMGEGLAGYDFIELYNEMAQ